MGEKDIQLVVASMMENPRVDKKLLLSNFLSQFQMSEDCPSPMARHLQAL